MANIEKLLAGSQTLGEFFERACLENQFYSDLEQCDDYHTPKLLKNKEANNHEPNLNTLIRPSTSLLGAIASGMLDQDQRAAIDLIYMVHTGKKYFVEKCPTRSI